MRRYNKALYVSHVYKTFYTYDINVYCISILPIRRVIIIMIHEMKRRTHTLQVHVGRYEFCIDLYYVIILLDVSA